MSAVTSPPLTPRGTTLLKTLAWKDYREQRAIWLTMAVLTVILALGTKAFSRGGPASDQQDVYYFNLFYIKMLASLGLVVMIGQGIVCGAQLFAGENDAGSLTFLDVLSPRRTPIWLTKLLIGAVLTLLQAVVLEFVLLIFGLGSWSDLPWFVAVGWAALLWGMLAGAMCDRVLEAILLGIVFVIGNFALQVLVPVSAGLLQVPLALAPLLLSYRSFCADDRDRLFKERQAKQPRRAPRSWQALLWLTERQGRWIVWPGLAACLVGGLSVWYYHDFIWTIVTLSIGLVCGLAVFAPEQGGEQDRFLGSQRFPPGRVWLIKSLFWALAAALMAGLFYLGAHYRLMWREGRTDPRMFVGYLFPDGNQRLFIVEWLIYGFACGQLASLLARRIVVAGFLAVALAVFLLLWWLPSLLIGGVAAWQILAVPVILLITTCLGMWAWFSDQLYARRHRRVLVAGGAAVAVWIGANLWHRAVAIPDVGEPFDVRAFDAQLTEAAHSPANDLIRNGLAFLSTQLNTVDETLPKAKRPIVRLNQNREPLAPSDYNLRSCKEILDYGWPAKDDEINPWLDDMFMGQWVDNFRAVASEPLGLLIDPRRFDTSGFSLSDVFACERAARLFAVRSMQRTVRGNPKAALDDLKVVLGLARQYEHCYPTGTALGWPVAPAQQAALRGHDFLLQHKPSPETLRHALDILQNDEKRAPNPLDSMKANYVITLKHPARFFHSREMDVGLNATLVRQALQTPWEAERQTRLINAAFQGAMRNYSQANSSWKTPGEVNWGLDLTDSSWSHDQWTELVHTLPWSVRWPWYFGPDHGLIWNNRVRQLETALMLYQIDAGHAAAKLDDLVPRYLPSLPVNTLYHGPFQYRVSKGEEVKGEFPSLSRERKTMRLLSGQGVIYLGTPDEGTWFPVPVVRKN